MKNRLVKKNFLASILLIFLSTSFVSPTQAAWNDNPTGVYYKLSEIVYDVGGNKHKNVTQKKLLDLGKAKDGKSPKFKIIDAINVEEEPIHASALAKNGKSTHKLDNTGFRAMAVVVEDSKKLFIVFAGTNGFLGETFVNKKFNLDNSTFKDAATAGKAVIDGDAGQNIQAQLYTNYIYNKFPQYQNYNWYFAGHSLGGWLATKTYLDIRSAKWLVSSSKFRYGGAIGKKEISGVFVFNPLPIYKKSVSSTQWNANLNGTYDKNIQNYIIQNEWLNGVRMMHSSDLYYFGSTKYYGRLLSSHRDIYYQPSFIVGVNLLKYYGHAYLMEPAIINEHHLVSFKNYVDYNRIEPLKK